MRRLLLLLGAAACTPAGSPTPPIEDDGCEAATGEATPDAWGGDTRLALDASGLFRAEALCGRWWLVTPEGHPVWSLGVNTVGPWGSTGQETGTNAYAETVAERYGSDAAWAELAYPRLRSWGLNTAGSWSEVDLALEHGLAVAVNLRLSGGDWLSGDVADWWDPAWTEGVEATVAAQVAPRVGEPGLLGWFLDNELRWGPDWRGAETLLQLYLARDAEAPGKAVAVDTLLAELGGVAGVNTALGTAYTDRDELLTATDWPSLSATAGGEEAAQVTTAFLELAAERYFAVTTGAIRAVDPEHLVLGNREVSVMTRAEVYEAAAAWVDVLSINNYVFVDGVAELALQLSGGLDPADGFAALHARVDLPILITEFGFRAADSGLPNTWPPQYPTFDTQTERAAAYTAYTDTYAAVPWVVGWHWFAWVDQPAEGRFDGENNNWGVVNVHDEPYAELTAAMADANARQADWLRVPR